MFPDDTIKSSIKGDFFKLQFCRSGGWQLLDQTKLFKQRFSNYNF